MAAMEGNISTYGKNLAAPEATALVAFMQTLRQPHEAVARDATVPAVARHRHSAQPGIALRYLHGPYPGSLTAVMDI